MHPDDPPPLNQGGRRNTKPHKPLLLVAALLWRDTHGPGPIRFSDLEHIVAPALQALVGAGDREAVLNPFWRCESMYWLTDDGGSPLRPARPSKGDEPVKHLADTRDHATGRFAEEFAASVDLHGTATWIGAILDRFVAPHHDAAEALELLRAYVDGTVEVVLGIEGFRMLAALQVEGGRRSRPRRRGRAVATAGSWRPRTRPSDGGRPRSWRSTPLKVSRTVVRKHGYLVKKVKRVGHGFRNFDNYRLRLLLHCGVIWQDQPTARIRARHPCLAA